MPIEGFNYQQFAEELASQAGELLPADFKDFQRNYVINTIRNFATLSGEAIYNDAALNFNADQAMLLTQIIAEWSFHKSVDLIKSGIIPEYWDGVMQKVAFTIFEISKQTISKNLPQDEILQVVEHHVKKSYQAALEELKERQVIDDEMLDKAVHQSNIDEMMHKMQAEQQLQAVEEASSGVDYQQNAKILKLASVALLLKQVSHDKVQTILNKFSPQDAQDVVQYMKMPDLETKVDRTIAMKCLQEIKLNLPEPRYVSPEKILSKMGEIFTKVPKVKIDTVIAKERPNVKEFVSKAREGEYYPLPSKVANIIAKHLEESLL